MRPKTVLLAAVLALFALTLASAKTYSITFSNNMKIGTVQLKPGDYKLAVDGSKATFTDLKSKQTFTTDTKVENTQKSFENTRVDSSTDGATTVVKDIEVGGSKLKLGF